MIVLAVAAVVVVALLAALLAADRGAVIRGQGRIAAHVRDWGFAAGPQVRIAGLPFLTQRAARRLSKVVICAAGKKLGSVQVKRLDVTLYGVRAGCGGAGRTASAAVWHRPGRLRRPGRSGPGAPAGSAR